MKLWTNDPVYGVTVSGWAAALALTALGFALGLWLRGPTGAFVAGSPGIAMAVLLAPRAKAPGVRTSDDWRQARRRAANALTGLVLLVLVIDVIARRLA